MAKPRLLICFDAFGTLFAPKRPVPQQYAEVARSLGLVNVREADVELHFKDAFKKEMAQHPIYGKASGMNAEQWWTNIITNTFRPIVGFDKHLPKDLVPRLLHRFWSQEGYKLMPDVEMMFHQLRKRYHHGAQCQVVVGVITNSDDRVPDILTSLALRVAPARYGLPRSPAISEEQFDIDFAIMSFDVGHEKPDASIFRAAEDMLQHKISDAGDDSVHELQSWNKIYVGDEYKTDVVGAGNAEWHAVLVGSQEEVSSHADVKWLDDQPIEAFSDIFKDSRAVGISRLARLAGWLSAGI